jgi:hypothetical protein
MYVSCIVTSIPLLTKVHTLSCNDGVTQIWFPNLYRMYISTRVTTWGPVIRSLFVWPTGRRISSSPCRDSHHFRSNPHRTHILGRLCCDYEGYYILRYFVLILIS